MTTKLTKNGYTIKKSEHSTSLIKEIKDELTVKPFSYNKNQKKKTNRFCVFLESPKKLYLPRFYGYKKFGEPTDNKIEGGDDIDISFNGSLRPEQEPIEQLYLKNAEERGGGII